MIERFIKSWLFLDSMDLIVKKPTQEPIFQSIIYTTKENPAVYRVLIGMFGTEINYQGTLAEDIAFSDFMNRDGIERWVNEEIKKLTKKGKKVEFDENFGYKMNKVIDQLADESPIRI